MRNPLLDFSGLPRFGAIRPEHVVPAMESLVAQGRVSVEALVAAPGETTWEGFVEPLEDARERVARAWAQVSHLNAVLSSPALRQAYNTALPRVTEFMTEQAQDLRLFAKFKALAAAPAFSGLPPAQRRHVENELRDFRLGGAELPDEAKARFKLLQEELAAHSARFRDNVLDATNAFATIVSDATHVRGIPDDTLASANEAAQKDGRDGWKFTLQMPCYLPVMQYADHRPLREEMYRAFVTRASESGKADWDNTALIGRILEARAEAASLLGYASYAELSLATKMARSPREVIAFLGDLGARARAFAERDMAEIAEFAQRRLGLPEASAWDVPYASEKLRQERYSFSDDEVRQYFPEDAVLGGLFRLIETLYGVRVKQDTADAWHADVKFFSIEEAGGRLVGQFYLDLYAREAKQGGAWMSDARNRRRLGDRVQTPVAFLTCNFPGPVGGRPALFTHKNVITLFHEFGHGLHQLLTQVDVLGVSGIKGVEWDAVELPSQFMENFCWEWEILANMTRHADTGEPLSRALFDKMIAAKNFHSGMQFVRQLEFALFDMHLHFDFDRAAESVASLLDRVRRQVAVLFPPQWSRFENQFSHIFGGGYAAGYYSYKWAEVLSADAFSAFEEEGVLNPATGERFRSEVLAVGGSRRALESFVAFRGREPRIEALLRHNAMTVTA